MSPVRDRSTRPEDVFTVDGVTLSVAVDDDGDVIKLVYIATFADGRTQVIDWTPFFQMDRDDFARWMRLGCPGRRDNGPLTRQQLVDMEARRAA